MADTKQSRSNGSKAYEGAEFKFCCGDSEEISQMMRRFCGGEYDANDAKNVLQHPCKVEQEIKESGFESV